MKCLTSVVDYLCINIKYLLKKSPSSTKAIEEIT